MFPFPFSFIAPTASGLDTVDNVYSMEFDGLNDYINCGFMPSLDAVQHFTINTWVNMPNVSGTKRMMGKRYSSAYLIAFNFTNNVLYLAVNGSYGYANANFSINTWYNIAMVFDGTLTGNANRLKLYIDGVQQTLTFVNTVPSITYNFALNPSTFYLGTDGFSTPNYYDGKMDEVAIFDYSLDSDQVEEIYNATSTGKTADLSAMATPPVAWYRMGD